MPRGGWRQAAPRPRGCARRAPCCARGTAVSNGQRRGWGALPMRGRVQQPVLSVPRRGGGGKGCRTRERVRTRGSVFLLPCPLVHEM